VPPAHRACTSLHDAGPTLQAVALARSAPPSIALLLYAPSYAPWGVFDKISRLSRPA